MTAMRMSCACALALAAGIGNGAPAAGPAAFSWQEPHARVLPAGDLAWEPKAFVFEAGPSVRYIDFDAGDDAADGTSREAPWKHHPWDPAASGRSRDCRGAHTYVFKRGVDYRGALVVRESGVPGRPIRLTSDPSWGEGEAVICGSDRVTGWSRGADHPDIPDPDGVWVADTDFAPRCVWMIDNAGVVTRIPLARTPNWDVSDPDDVKSEWWHWDYKDAKPFDVFTEVNGKRLHLGIDSAHLTEPAEYYRGAILWTEHGWVAGAPYPVAVEHVDPETNGLGFGGRWGAAGGYKIVRFNRYFLEDKPHYLDDPNGEFWFDRKGEGGRLYLRLPGGIDPNAVRVEAARRSNPVAAEGVSHLEVTGLSFRFTNPHWRLDGVPYAQGEEIDPACIRVLGGGTGIRVANCRFAHVQSAVRMKALGRNDLLDRIVVSDNEVECADRGAFNLAEGSAWGEVLPASGLLGDVSVLRNRIRLVGLRPTRFDTGFAINILNARTAEIAGNIVERCYSGGINVFGGKRSGSARDCPLSRILIHHNKVVDSLLSNDDYGGIETWQGGPAYVYNNISGNPGGYRNFWLLNREKPGSARFGHAYYLDGAFKNYHFNNIAWGKSSDPFSRLGNASAFQEIHSYQNTFFNNTVYNFVKGTRRQAPQAGRDKFLGNVWQNIGEWLFWHATPANTPEEGNAADAGPRKTEYDIGTNAYSGNVFHGVAESFGVFEPSGRWHLGLGAFRDALAASKPIAGDVGVEAENPPLRDPAAFDFRPAPDSPGRDRGARVFVPWALYAEVGEWNFYMANGRVDRVLDEHWTMTPYHLKRDDYYLRPTYPLELRGVGPEDRIPGPLEDWTRGALRFNGRDAYAVIAHEVLAKPFAYELEYTADGKQVKETRTAAGAELKNVQVHGSSFLIEIVFRLEPAGGAGVLVEKAAGNGYGLRVDARGHAVFAVRGPGGAGTVTTSVPVRDGEWHHLVAECDRVTQTVALFLDGKPDAAGPGIGAAVVLANDGDFLVGGTPAGDCLAVTIDFLRVALGSFADAETTIEELYAWEFAGPALRDFTGRTPTGAKRDAGALELEP